MTSRTSHLLLALLALFATDSIHGWLHVEGPDSIHTVEFHDGSCEHIEDHAHEGDCLLCSLGRSELAALAATPVAAAILPTTATQLARRDEAPRPSCVQGVLGARAPPALG